MITIFTPVYNRASTLPRLYKSIKAQTCKDFEWLIVNDGSTDNSGEIIQDFLKKAHDFPIQYYVKENGGKHRAINYAVPLAKGELFFIVDSDDWLANNAIEKMIDTYKGIADDESFAGLAGIKITEDGMISGKTFSGEYIDATSLERRPLNIIGEKSEAFKTSILKQYPFPEFDGENFISEAVVWNRIANDGFKMRWFNSPIYFFEYQEFGLTSNLRKLYAKNPKGYMLYIKQEIEFLRVSKLQALSWQGRVIDTLRLRCSAEEVCFGLGITKARYYMSRLVFKLYSLKRLLVHD